jgi:Mg-chelatase subunit ChlD
MRLGMRFRLSATFLAACVLTATVGTVVGTSALAAGHGGADYVLLVDCTGTMQYADRGTATLDALESFVTSLNEGDRVTVYGYGEEPFPALADYPVTIGSAATGKAIAEALRLPFTANRTDITRGLELAWQERAEVFSRALSGGRAAPGGSAYAILLTDGKLVPMYDDYAQYSEIYHESRARLRQLGRLFADAGIPIYSVGLGRAEKVDGELLTQVCESSGGVYRHAVSSDDLIGVFASLMDDVIAPPSAVIAVGSTTSGSEGIASAVTTDTGKNDEMGEEEGCVGVVMETASASTPGRTSNRKSELSQLFGHLGPQAYHAIIGVLGVMMGFVAIGIHKRQSWTNAFTKPLLQKEIRVKGYLRRILPDGVMAAHSNIPIENPGLPMLEVGMGTDYASELHETLIELDGTTDGSPPLLKVVKGSVRVSGELVENVRALVDGDIIECEGKAYKYLRGQRR